MHAPIATALCSALVLAACATPEVLESWAAVAPAGIDFSGYWQKREGSGDGERRIGEAIKRATAPEPPIVPRQHGHQQRRSTPAKDHHGPGGQVQVFLETGKALKITQTQHGIFISYDRSVVEEYRFGENRMISIGPIDAQRVSGWDGQDYVTETLDKDRMKLTERLRLLDGGRVLQREIVFRNPDLHEVSMQQLFDRKQK